MGKGLGGPVAHRDGSNRRQLLSPGRSVTPGGRISKPVRDPHVYSLHSSSNSTKPKQIPASLRPFSQFPSSDPSSPKYIEALSNHVVPLPAMLGNIVNSNTPGHFGLDHPEPRIIQPVQPGLNGVPSGATTFPVNDFLRPGREITTGLVYQDRTQTSPSQQLLTQAQQAAKNKESIEQQRNRSLGYLDQRSRQRHEAPPCTIVQQPVGTNDSTRTSLPFKQQQQQQMLRVLRNDVNMTPQEYLRLMTRNSAGGNGMNMNQNELRHKALQNNNRLALVASLQSLGIS